MNFFGNSIPNSRKSTQNAPEPTPLASRALSPSLSASGAPLVVSARNGTFKNK